MYPPKCKKCNHKSILVIGKYNEKIFYDRVTTKLITSKRWKTLYSLCVDHAPKMNDGSPGYNKFTRQIVLDSYGVEPLNAIHKCIDNICHYCGKETNYKRKIFSISTCFVPLGPNFIHEGKIIPSDYREGCYQSHGIPVPDETIYYWECESHCKKCWKCICECRNENVL